MATLNSIRKLRNADKMFDANGNAAYGACSRFIENIALGFVGDECLIWPFKPMSTGYAFVHMDGRQQLAHRLVCETVHGPCPPDKNEAAHSCGNRLCVNPQHLRWASWVENSHDKVLHGTLLKGTELPQAVLTEEKVRAIRALKGKLKQTEIAEKFGIARTTVSAVLNGYSWAWVT